MRAVSPYLFALLADLLIITFVPGIITFLPNLLR